MADAPNPDAPHEHLFHPHQRDRAHEVAARGGGAAVVVCVICGSSVTLDPASASERARVVQRVEEVAPATLARITAAAAAAAPGEGGQREEIVGLAQAAWPTFDARFWRVVVGQRVLFAHAGRGHLEVLRAAHDAGEAVVVGALWASGDCYIQIVRRA